MAITELERTLQCALQQTGLRELPKKITASYNKTWIRGICRVLKAGNIKNYALCENYGSGLPTIKKDFGIPSIIIKVEAIYPYEEFDSKNVPDLRSNKATITYLSKSGYDISVIEKLLSKDGKTPEQIKADKDTIKQYVNEVAMKYAKMQLAEKDRINEMAKYSKRIEK